MADNFPRISKGGGSRTRGKEDAISGRVVVILQKTGLGFVLQCILEEPKAYPNHELELVTVAVRSSELFDYNVLWWNKPQENVQTLRREFYFYKNRRDRKRPWMTRGMSKTTVWNLGLQLGRMHFRTPACVVRGPSINEGVFRFSWARPVSCTWHS